MTEPMDRMVSLSVGVVGDEDYFQTFQDISELARNLGASHGYVSVSASVVGAEDDSEPEQLYYNENTVYKVREAIMKIGLSSRSTDDIINNILNTGVLFRERARS